MRQLHGLAVAWQARLAHLVHHRIVQEGAAVGGRRVRELHKASWR